MDPQQHGAAMGGQPIPLQGEYTFTDRELQDVLGFLEVSQIQRKSDQVQETWNVADTLTIPSPGPDTEELNSFGEMPNPTTVNIPPASAGGLQFQPRIDHMPQPLDPSQQPPHPYNMPLQTMPQYAPPHMASAQNIQQQHSMSHMMVPPPQPMYPQQPPHPGQPSQHPQAPNMNHRPPDMGHNGMPQNGPMPVSQHMPHYPSMMQQMPVQAPQHYGQYGGMPPPHVKPVMVQAPGPQHPMPHTSSSPNLNLSPPVSQAISMSPSTSQCNLASHPSQGALPMMGVNGMGVDDGSMDTKPRINKTTSAPVPPAGSGSAIQQMMPLEINQGPNSKQVSHGASEKQRRDRINSMIDQLRQLVPIRGVRSNGDSADPANVDGTFGVEGRRSKYVVLAETINMIRNMKTELEDRDRQIETMKGEIEELNKFKAETEANEKMQIDNKARSGSTGESPKANGGSASVGSRPSPTFFRERSNSKSSNGGTKEEMADELAAAEDRANNSPVPSESISDSDGGKEVASSDIGEMADKAEDEPPQEGVVVDMGPDHCFIKVTCTDRRGLLGDILNTFKMLPIEVVRAAITTRNEMVTDIFDVKVYDGCALTSDDIRMKVIEGMMLASPTAAGEKRRRVFCGDNPEVNKENEEEPTAAC